MLKWFLMKKRFYDRMIIIVSCLKKGIYCLTEDDEALWYSI